MNNNPKYKSYTPNCNACSDVGVILVDADSPDTAPYAFKCSCSMGMIKYSALPSVGQIYRRIKKEDGTWANQAKDVNPSYKRSTAPFDNAQAIVRKPSFVINDEDLIF
jgi:hypothetical protein